MTFEQIGDCRLYLGDCREILTTLKKVDAVITDPPYGINLGVGNDKRGGAHGLAKQGYENFSDTLEDFRSVIVPSIQTALNMAQRGAVFSTLNLHELPKPDAIGGVYLPAASGLHCWGRASLSPVAFYGVAPDLNLGPRPSAIWSTESAEKNGHPCPKPLGWMKWLVHHASRANETILDPFMGSGTTGVACVKLGRKFIGIEIEPAYFDTACKRIELAYAQADLFVELEKKETKKTDQLDMLADV